MNNSLDKEIKKTLNKKAENIKASETLLTSIKSQLEERENKNMKRFSFTPRTIVVASLLTVALATGVIASGGVASIVGHSDTRDAINHFPTAEEVQEVVNYTPKYVENLGGYEFEDAQPSDSSDIDEVGNTISSYKDISFNYKTDKGILALSTTPAIREGDETGETIDYNGITLYYSSYTYKSVPPEYKETEEDKKLEASGELMIGYGSDKVEEQKTQNIIWVEDNITYNLMDMGVEIDKSDFISMAEQVIDTK